MYLIRRVWVTEPGQARMAASLAVEIGKRYVDAGQRDSVRVSFNGGTLPGEKDRVYMEWTADVIEAPYRADNEIPADPRGLGPRMRAVTKESWIEFYEVLTDDKAIAIDD
jgi:hypothetical protein